MHLDLVCAGVSESAARLARGPQSRPAPAPRVEDNGRTGEAATEVGPPTPRPISNSEVVFQQWGWAPIPVPRLAADQRGRGTGPEFERRVVTGLPDHSARLDCVSDDLAQYFHDQVVARVRDGMTYLLLELHQPQIPDAGVPVCMGCDGAQEAMWLCRTYVIMAGSARDRDAAFTRMLQHWMRLTQRRTASRSSGTAPATLSGTQSAQRASRSRVRSR